MQDDGFVVAPADLDELEALYESLILAHQTAAAGKVPQGLFRIANRLKHITVRTRGLIE